MGKFSCKLSAYRKLIMMVRSKIHGNQSQSTRSLLQAPYMMLAANAPYFGKQNEEI